MINLWRPYSFIQPKKDGWYQCTCKHGKGENNPSVMDLYFIKHENKWVDKRRQTVFEGYKVYESCRAPIEDNRVYTDTSCERIDVTAWRKLPKPCKLWMKGVDND